jgi:hypothetical protein
LSEFIKQLKKMASALGATPVTLPGKSITGDVTALLISFTTESSSIWSMAVDPPTKMALAPHFSTVAASLAAILGEIFSESIKPTQIV